MNRAVNHADDEVIQRITLKPDARLIKSLGANHSLESAIADLVDNSIDAGATRVSVRLLTRQDRLVQVEVLDDGLGMDADTINEALTIGHQRAYLKGDLGHFGMGLKAASFGHSNVLTVWSTKAGATPVGRRIRRADFSKDFTCEVLSSDAAAEHGTDRETILRSDVGTSVIWTEIRNAYLGHSSPEARNWLATRNDALRSHLGVTFHRLLADKRLHIDVLVDEQGDALELPGVPVLPIDPFGYATSGHPEYPKVLVAKASETRVEFTCHIWPAKSDVTGFRIGAKTGEQFQGFFIYRNDRLLQVGGWSDMANHSPARQLARVMLEDTEAIGSVLTMNSEKNGLRFEPIFHDAISRASSSDGTTFTEYLQDSESIFTNANRRKRLRKPVIRPDKGFAPAIRKRIGTELPFLEGASVHLKWRRMDAAEFFDVDLPTKTLWLNSRYRSLFAPSGGSLNDAPVLKTLMFLLTHHVFEGRQLGSRDKDDIALWRSVLSTAIIAEERIRGGE